MTRQDHMRDRLPQPPAPSEQARGDAIATALQRFDAAKAEASQGNEDDVRLMDETAHAPRPSRRSIVMSSSDMSSPDMSSLNMSASGPKSNSNHRFFDSTRTRQLIAASAVVLVAGSAMWVSYDALRVPGTVAPNINEATPPVVADIKAKPEAIAEARSDALAKINRAERDRAQLSASTAAAPAAPSSSRLMETRQRPAQDGRVLSGVVRPLPPAPMPDVVAPAEPVGRDQFAGAQQNGFKDVREAPVSTFSIDVDTASYSFMRASLNRNVLPQPAAVRTEELVNYFPYDYAAPTSASEPFRTTVSVFPSPWSPGRKIVQIGVKGYALPSTTRPRANLVFLIDTSGSMNAPNRLPLVKQSLTLLLGQLDPDDRVSIVTYAGSAGTVLEPTAVSDKTKIIGVHRQSGGGRQHGRRGRHPAGLFAGRAQFRSQGRQSRRACDRWRLQCRHHRAGTS